MSVEKRASSVRPRPPKYPGALGVASSPTMRPEEIAAEQAGVVHRRGWTVRNGERVNHKPKAFDPEATQKARRAAHESLGLRLLAAHYGVSWSGRSLAETSELLLRLARDHVPYFMPESFDGSRKKKWSRTRLRDLIVEVEHRKKEKGDKSDSEACEWIAANCHVLFKTSDKGHLQNKLAEARSDSRAAAAAALLLRARSGNHGR